MHPRRETCADPEELRYQPVLDLTRSEVVAVEVLVAAGGDPAAASTDQLQGAERVLGEACRQGVSWEQQGLVIDISVNAPASQLVLPGYLSVVERSLTASGLPPSRLTVEVAEPAVVEERAVANALTGIAGLGVTAALDDFGTGLTSLVHLRRYPVGQLKIDASFVAGLGRSHDDRAVVSSVIGLGRALGVTCVASGVDTDEQAALLLELGCDRVQGSLYSPPVPAAQVPAAIDAAEARLVTPPARSRTVERVPEAVLAHMRQLHEAGASHHTIAASLNQMGSRHAGGRRWHPASVARALADSARAPRTGSRV